MKFLALILLIIVGGIITVACSTGGGDVQKPDVVVIEDIMNDPATLQMAGMIYAWQRPESAVKMQKVCSATVLLQSEDAVLKYATDQLVENTFDNMTPAQKEVTQAFIVLQAKRLGVNIDFTKQVATAMDGFELNSFKTGVVNVCKGIAAGLEG